MWNDVPCATSAAFVCESFDPPQVKQYNGHSYTVFEWRKTYVDAQRSCAELGQSLVTINDAAEETWLKQQFPSVSFWIGDLRRAGGDRHERHLPAPAGAGWAGGDGERR